MHITKFELITDLEGFVEALRFFEELDDPTITFEHEKAASPIQRIGPGTHYQYELKVYSDQYPPRNVYPILRDLEKRIDHLRSVLTAVGKLRSLTKF